MVRPLAKAVCRGAKWRSSAQSAEKFFHLHFSVVWIGSRSTFVLCTALLTAEYAEGDRAQLEGDRAQLEGQQRPQAL